MIVKSQAVNYVLRLLAMVGACVAVAFILASCDGDGRVEEPNIALINAAPGDYVGSSVVVNGTVQEIRQDNTMVIHSGPPELVDVVEEPSASEILVITRSPEATTPPVTLGDVVQVTGVVELFSPELAPEVGPGYQSATLPAVDAEFYRRWRNRPAIQATLIRRLSYADAP
jgi:DNA/RNA endonuclease YhcR with UshA esterase domain